MKEAENYKEELLRHRHYFHMHPELGLEEKGNIGIYKKLSGETGV